MLPDACEGPAGPVLGRLLATCERALLMSRNDELFREAFGNTPTRNQPRDDQGRWAAANSGKTSERMSVFNQDKTEPSLFRDEPWASDQERFKAVQRAGSSREAFHMAWTETRPVPAYVDGAPSDKGGEAAASAPAPSGWEKEREELKQALADPQRLLSASLDQTLEIQKESQAIAKLRAEADAKTAADEAAAVRHARGEE